MPDQRPLNRFGLPLAVVAGAAALRAALNPILGETLPFITLLPAVAFATWWGGKEAGVLSIVGGALMAAVFIFPSPADYLTTEPRYLMAIALFIVAGLVIALLIDSLRRQKQRLDEKRELLQTTLSSIGDGVIATDREARVTRINKVAELLTGWTAAEAVGQPITSVFRIINEETRSTVECPVTRALREGVIVGLANHTLLISRDGTERPIDDSAAPIRDGNGRTYGGVLVFRDVTERKRMEEELHGLVAALSEADRKKDEFLAILAHELRNPLAPMKNALELIKRSNIQGAEQVDRARAMAERQLSHMTRLVDDLMDVSRITRNKLELKVERLDLVELLGDVVNAHRPAFDSLAHTLEVALPAEPIYVHADAVRLSQAIGNLLSNACKYTERGGRVSVVAEVRGYAVEVRIKDSGVGIPAEMLPKIFDLFVQVDSSLEKSTGGLGIGLALVRRLIQMHGGTVEARSAGEGQGSEFVVRLPLRADGVQVNADRGDRSNVIPISRTMTSSLRESTGQSSS